MDCGPPRHNAVFFRPVFAHCSGCWTCNLDQGRLNNERASLYEPKQIFDKEVHVRIVRAHIGQIQIVYESILSVVGRWFVGHRTHQCRRHWAAGGCWRIAFDIDDSQIWRHRRRRRRLIRWSAFVRQRLGRFAIIERAETIDDFEAILLCGGFLGAAISGHLAGMMSNAIDHIDCFGFREFLDVAGDVFLELKRFKIRIRNGFMVSN